ncbi:MAG TPA: DinB family protein [Candidatus Sulfopaludibacter sp.]|nr:DinB family protein [Candidatus Sulfopaludibacter sp.]
MKRSAYWVVAAALACGALQAQTNPLIAEMRANYTNIKANLLRAAEKVPDEAYAYKPADSIRTFGALIGHIAGQYRACAAVTGHPGQIDTNKTSKADLVAALKASFAACDAAWESMNDKTATEMVSGRGGNVSKLGMLIFSTIVHNNEEYGYLAVYMRMKNIVPPSSER